MGALASYSLADFVPYSLDAWYALVGDYNAALWPLHPAVFIASLVLLHVAAAPPDRAAPIASRAAAAALALSWGLIGWFFMLERFMPLNWAAGYFGIAFVTEAMLLALFGALRPRLRPVMPGVARTAGLWLLGYAILVHPIVEPALFDRPLRASELFGIGPTATAIGTVGWALTRRGPVGWLLLIVPGIWIGFIALSRIGIAS